MTPEILQGISLGEDDREEGSSCSNSSAKNIDTEQENTVKLKFLGHHQVLLALKKMKQLKRLYLQQLTLSFH